MRMQISAGMTLRSAGTLYGIGRRLRPEVGWPLACKKTPPKWLEFWIAALRPQPAELRRSAPDHVLAAAAILYNLHTSCPPITIHGWGKCPPEGPWHTTRVFSVRDIMV